MERSAMHRVGTLAQIGPDEHSLWWHDHYAKIWIPEWAGPWDEILAFVREPLRGWTGTGDHSLLIAKPGFDPNE